MRAPAWQGRAAAATNTYSNFSLTVAPSQAIAPTGREVDAVAVRRQPPAMRLGHTNIIDRGQAAAIHGQVRDLLALAVQHQGAKALTSTKRAAAHHEAGHAVIYALEGLPVRRVRIRRERSAPAGVWIGSSNGGEAWAVNPYTEPAADLQRARLMLAGLVAEILLEGRDYAFGSSLDELVLASGVCNSAAHKLGRPALDVFGETLGQVFTALDRHRDNVRAIAAALMRHRLLRGPQLARLLPAGGGA